MCRSAHFKGDVLPIETFKKIADTLFPHARFVDLRGWGESTILPDFEAYLDIAMQYPPRLKLITNGVINKPRLWERLAREGVLVGISFDAADNDLFEVIRGGSRQEQVLRNLDRMIAASLASGHDPREQFYFCITVSGHNVGQLGRIIRLGNRHGVCRFKLEPLWAPEGDPMRLEVHRGHVVEAMSELDALADQLGVLIEYSASLLDETTYLPAVRKVCNHPWDYCYINCRGRIGFCDHLNGREEFTFGRWGDEDFMAFWNGREMTELRSQHLRRLGGEAITKCGDCNWCYDRRYMDLEDLIEPGWGDFRVAAGRSR